MINLKSSKKYSLLLPLVLMMATSVVVSAYIVTPTSAQVTDDWPMFHHDPAHTGYTTSTTPDQFKMAWKYETEGAVRSSPAVVGGKVYIGSDDGYLYCLDTNTGNLVWKYKTEGNVISSPAVANSKVYVGSFDNYVYCINAADGVLVWKYETGYPVYSSPCVVDGKVYIASNDKNIYCLNAADGTKIWTYLTKGQVLPAFNLTGLSTFVKCTGSPAVVDGKVYIGVYDGFVYCLNAADGTKIWEYKTVSPPCGSSPAVVDGKVYIGDDAQNVYAINATSGTLVWTHHALGLQYAGAPGTNAPIETTPAIAYGKIYVGTVMRMESLDAGTGTLLASGSTSFQIGSSAAIANNKVYAGCNDRFFYCWDANTLARNQRYGTLSNVISSPAIVDSKIYVGGDDCFVYCLVGGIAKSQTFIGVDVQPRTITLGKPTTVYGGMRLVDGLGPAGAAVTLTYTKPDRTTVTRTVTTKDDGAYDETFTPDAVGKWTVKASWLGNDQLDPAESSTTATFTVTAAMSKLSTTISASVSQTSVEQGNNLIVSGSISPSVSGATVTLTYTKPDGTTMTRTVTSQADGKFADTFTPDAVGNWNVKSSWLGSDTHATSTSTAAPFTVTEKAPSVESPAYPDYTPLFAGIIAAIVVVGILVIYSIFRKRQ